MIFKFILILKENINQYTYEMSHKKAEEESLAMKLLDLQNDLKSLFKLNIIVSAFYKY